MVDLLVKTSRTSKGLTMAAIEPPRRKQSEALATAAMPGNTPQSITGKEIAEMSDLEWSHYLKTAHQGGCKCRECNLARASRLTKHCPCVA